MKATDIMEALTDMDDDVLMRAEMDPPRRHIILLRSFRSAIAACLILALCITTVIVTDTFATETGLRWRVRYRDDEVTWLFKDGVEQEGELPNYEPTWLPEGYELDREYWWPTRERTMHFENDHDAQSRVWFEYMQITDKQIYSFGKLDQGTYEKETVEINGLPGELYTYVDDPESGQLIWIDKQSCIVFQLYFDCGAEDALRIAKSVILIEEE